MKKVLLFAIAIVAVSFASCTSKGNADQAPATDSIAAPVEAVEEVAAVATDSSAVVVDEVAVATEAAAN